MPQEAKLQTIWTTALGSLEVELGKSNFGLYFKNSQLLSLDNGVAKIGFPNKIVADQVNARYYSLLQGILQAATHLDRVSLVFETSDHPVAAPIENIGPLFETPKEDKEAVFEAVRRANLRPDFTLEEFCVSTSNQLPFAAAQAVAKNPGREYNPFFIWGDVGIGKTHLMHAVGHEILRKNSRARVIYVTAEQFTNEIVEGIRSKNTSGFKEKYRSADALLIDDIQFIAGKDRAQEEFFHTFNAVVQHGGQVVLTSDTKPGDIKFIEDRLRSRFEGGMVADISEPDHELKTAICLLKAKKRGIEISTNIASLVASSVDNIRSLEGTLQRVLSEIQIKKLPLTEISVAKILKISPVNSPAVSHVDSRQLLDLVCAYYNLPIKLIKSEKRDKPISEPRQILMYLLKCHTRMTLTEIASFLDRKDHTTVLHAVRKITSLLSTNEQVQKDINKIEEDIHTYPQNLSTSR
ncbi:chromosomal replication initiator protein DnaA [Candidatus Microgenomates bacterium]|nr:chromosomal replication initiator protein DnaA [Candidatus Microgenomates bacterium]